MSQETHETPTADQPTARQTGSLVAIRPRPPYGYTPRHPDSYEIPQALESFPRLSTLVAPAHAGRMFRAPKMTTVVAGDSPCSRTEPPLSKTG